MFRVQRQSSRASRAEKLGALATSRHSQTGSTRHRNHSHRLAHTSNFTIDTASTRTRHNGIPRPPSSVPGAQQHKPRIPDQRRAETREAACGACEEACWRFSRRVSRLSFSTVGLAASSHIHSRCKHDASTAALRVRLARCACSPRPPTSLYHYYLSTKEACTSYSEKQIGERRR